MNVHSPVPTSAGPLEADDLQVMEAWWRAANDLSVGQVYPLDDSMLRVPLTMAHVKPRLLGQFGTTPGLNLIYLHLNRLDRFHLVMDAIDRVPQLGPDAAYAIQAIRDKLVDHKHDIRQHGIDMPEVLNWRWPVGKPGQP